MPASSTSRNSVASRRTIASCCARVMDPESQAMIGESMKPQWEPPVIDTSCASPSRLSNMGVAVDGATIESCEPTRIRTAARIEAHACVEEGFVSAGAIGTMARTRGSLAAASIEQPAPIE